MAGTPEHPNHINVNVTHLGGLEVNPAIIEQFRNELEAIRKSLETQRIAPAEQVADATRRLADHQRDSGSVSPRASRQIVYNMDSIPAGKPKITPKQVRSELGETSRSIGQRFIDFTNDMWKEYPFDPHGYRDYANLENRRMSEGASGHAAPFGGGGGREGGRSPTASSGDDDGRKRTWRDFIDKNLVNERLEIPRTGRFTAEDALSTIADFLGRRALKLDAAGNTQRADIYGSSAMWMERAAHSWAPHAAIAKQYLERFGISIDPRDYAQAGYGQGVSAKNAIGPSEINLGPFGFRNPLNAATGTGFRIEVSQTAQALKAGLNRSQVNDIYGNLFGRGYYFDGNRFGALRDTSESMMKFNPAIASDPQFYDALDKWSRFSTTGGLDKSLKNFVATMKQIPGAARAANVSLAQMTSDMVNWGEISRSNGGSFANGARTASAFARITGAPASLGAQLMQNPFVQAQAMTHFGLAPWQQGLLSPEQGVASEMAAVQQMYNAMGPNPPDITKTDALGNKYVITGRQQRIANMHMNFPELPPELLDKWTRPGAIGHYQAMVNASQAMRDWSNSVRKNPALLGNAGPHSWEAMNNYLKRAGFSSSDRSQIFDAGQPRAGKRIAERGGVATVVTGITAAQAASKRFNKFNEILAKKTQSGDMTDPNVPKVWIGLQKNAARALHVSPDRSAKASANTGGTGLNGFYGTGPGPGISPFQDLFNSGG